MFGIPGLARNAACTRGRSLQRCRALQRTELASAILSNMALHERSAHLHNHGFWWRSLLIGLMHGMPGSAALLVLAVSQVTNPIYGLLYILLFGIGSIFGMSALSTVIAAPLAMSARWLTWSILASGRHWNRHHRNRCHDEPLHYVCVRL